MRGAGWSPAFRRKNRLKPELQPVQRRWPDHQAQLDTRALPRVRMRLRTCMRVLARVEYIHWVISKIRFLSLIAPTSASCHCRIRLPLLAKPAAKPGMEARGVSSMLALAQ